MKNLVLVYLVDNYNDELNDNGDDPCFKNPPTWGICRPDIRNEEELDTGSRLLFVARVIVNNERKYYIKGYFKVHSKITIIEAFESFSTRQNVIISKENNNINNGWDSENWRIEFTNHNLEEIPEYLKKFSWSNQNYFQKSGDRHGIDNWKCRRIFNCYIRTFRYCISNNHCYYEHEQNRLKRNYIVGSSEEFQDWNYLRVEWSKLAQNIGLRQNLLVGHNHPELEISHRDFDNIIEYMNEKTVANGIYSNTNN